MPVQDDVWDGHAAGSPAPAPPARLAVCLSSQVAQVTCPQGPRGTQESLPPIYFQSKGNTPKSRPGAQDLLRLSLSCPVLPTGGLLSGARSSSTSPHQHPGLSPPSQGAVSSQALCSCRISPWAGTHFVPLPTAALGHGGFNRGLHCRGSRGDTTSHHPQFS